MRALRLSHGHQPQLNNSYTLAIRCSVLSSRCFLASIPLIVEFYQKVYPSRGGKLNFAQKSFGRPFLPNSATHITSLCLSERCSGNLQGNLQLLGQVAVAVVSTVWPSPCQLLAPGDCAR